MISSPRRKSERLIEVVVGGVFVFVKQTNASCVCFSLAVGDVFILIPKDIDDR